MIRLIQRIGIALLTLVVSGALFAQSKTTAVVTTTEAAMEEASARIEAAKSLGAERYAKELLDEAIWRLNFAKEQIESGKPATKSDAMLRAVQAKEAADAAEAKARWLGAVAEVQSLREEIKGFGASLPDMVLYVEPTDKTARGETSASRIEVARRALTRSREAGAATKYEPDLQKAESYLGSAEKVARATKQSDSADHLAYVAEMMARRAEYLTRLEGVAAMVPDLRMKRSELATAAMEAKAAEERRQREESEKQMAEMRQKLEQEQAKRDELRRQIEQQEKMLMSQLESDRAARIEAERRLDLLRAEHETALARAKSIDEAEPLRRRVEDQEILVRSLIQREIASERAAEASLERLGEQLVRDRQSGVFDAATLDAYSNDLQQRRQDLSRMREQRIQAEYDRTRLAEAYETRVVASEKRLRETEAESARAAQMMEEERQRAAQAEAELKRMQDEMAKREAEAAKMMVEMKEGLTQIAPTRSNDRGQFVVSLTRLFDSGKTAIKEGVRTDVAKIAALLRTNNDRIRVVVEGHTDNVGGEEANLRLSEARAKAVADFLVAEGLRADAVSSIGKGESEPVATNDNAAGRQQNRRVDLVIVEMN